MVFVLLLSCLQHPKKIIAKFSVKIAVQKWLFKTVQSYWRRTLHDRIGGTKRGNVTPEDRINDQKRSRSEQSSCECNIHCTDDDTELVRPKDEESWNTLRAAAVRKHKPLLDIAETLNEGEILSIYYHRKCRSLFTMKKLLETISKQQGTDDQQPTKPKRTWSDSSLPLARLTNMYAYSMKRRVSILREQEIGNPWYNAEIWVQITQFENQPWKRRTAGFSQLRPVKL